MNRQLRVWRRPSANLFGFPTDFDRWFDRVSGNHELAPTWQQDFVPAADVEETKTHYVLSFDVPGLSKKDVEVKVEGDKLTVSGERKSETEEKKHAYHRSERRYGKFERTFSLPNDVDASKVEAVHKDGVLSVAVPKTEAEKPHQVEVRDGSDGFFKKILGSKETEKTAS